MEAPGGTVLGEQAVLEAGHTRRCSGGPHPHAPLDLTFRRPQPLQPQLLVYVHPLLHPRGFNPWKVAVPVNVTTPQLVISSISLQFVYAESLSDLSKPLKIILADMNAESKLSCRGYHGLGLSRVLEWSIRSGSGPVLLPRLLGLSWCVAPGWTQETCDQC